MDTTITLLQEGLELFGEICEEAPTESEEWQWRWRVRHLLEDAAAPATPDLLAKAADLLPVLVEEMDDARPTLADLKVMSYQLEQLGKHGEVDVSLERRIQGDGTELWAILEHGAALSKDGYWVYEPQPSSRTAAYFERTRFASAEEALQFWQDGNYHGAAYDRYMAWLAERGES